jgi:hypothetical protein
MVEHTVWCFTFLLTLLDVVVKSKIIHENGHGKGNSKSSMFCDVLIYGMFQICSKNI